MVKLSPERVNEVARLGRIAVSYIWDVEFGRNDGRDQFLTNILQSNAIGYAVRAARAYNMAVEQAHAAVSP